MSEMDLKDLYRAFEETFRGSEALIRERLRVYRPLLDHLPAERRGFALDLGCGRGEWLSLTEEWGFARNVGVEPDVSMHSETGERVEIVAADALAYLKDLPDASVECASAFHLIEHLEPGDAFAMLCEMHRVLSDGGVLIVETPNPENLMVGLWSFHLDPTHHRPIPPVHLDFQVDKAGFDDRAILRLNGQMEEGRDTPIARLALAGPDYSIVAIKGADKGRCKAFTETLPQETPADYGWVIEGELRQASEIDALKAFAEETRRFISSDDRPKIEDRIEAHREEMKARTQELAEETADLKNQLQTLLVSWNAVLNDQAALRAERDAIVASRSWRLTRPLREVSFLAGRINHYRRMPREDLMRSARADLADLSRRAGRRAAVDSYRMLMRFPPSARFAKNTIARIPALDRRLRYMMLPDHLLSAMGVHLLSGGDRRSFVETRNSTTALERLRAAERLDANEGDGAADRKRDAGRKPRLAYVSPLPPERSGIAAYGREILPELARFYDVTAIGLDPSDGIDLGEGIAVRGAEWFEDNAHRFERVVYHFGNSFFHHHMIALLRAIPGVVVLHDFYLGNMLAQLELEEERGPVWTEALINSHGYEAAALRMQPDGIPAAIDIYPANFDIFREATGVIVHSAFSARLAADFYPKLLNEAVRVVPHGRAAPPSHDRAAARAALGLGEDDFVVCSFGFLNYTKLNDRLLSAWRASTLAADPSCRLIFVGEADGSAGSLALLNEIEASGKGRVRVTGYADQRTYELHLAAADVAVQLRAVSRGETSGAVLDCMAHGLATIVNANGAMAELPEDAVVRLDDRFSDEDLVEALQTLFEDGATRRRLSERARAHVDGNLGMAVSAEGYRDAMEEFYAQAATVYDHRRLAAAARESADEGGDGEDALRALASTIGRDLRRPAPKIYLDVSAVVQQDLRTGIQRVVRAIVLRLFAMELRGYRVEPVWNFNIDGEWHYFHAANLSLRLLGCEIETPLGERAIDVGEDDIFVGLDFFAHGQAGASRQGLYDAWREAGASVNFVVYDILPITMPHRFPPDSGPMHRIWLESICNSADRLVCISGAVADDVRTWLRETRHPRAEEIEIVAWTLGADIEASAPTLGIEASDDAVLKRLASRRSFLMVGTIEPRKGHRDMLEAFEKRWAKGSEDVLVLVGSEGWKGVPLQDCRDLPETIERLRNHRELGKRLVWFSSASDEFLGKVYGAADVLVAASEGEGFGLPLVEAAQRGLPIIARDIPVFREVAGEHAFFFGSEDAGGLAEEIDAWAALFEAGEHPKTDGLQWKTWDESTRLLFEAVGGASRSGE